MILTLTLVFMYQKLCMYIALHTTPHNTHTCKRTKNMLLTLHDGKLKQSTLRNSGAKHKGASVISAMI
eukprot:m.909375 g.909375  ORF g.909375 m.909375 type:complete len:68 (-) comp23720_c0_seq4:106-309(-)